MQEDYKTDSLWFMKGDCLVVMDELIDEGVIVDAIITDPPYGTTACKWDSVIPFDEMWERLNKLIKPNGAIVLFGSEPFSSALRMSNIKNYKYDWVWDKKLAGNGILAKHQPLKIHELVHIFSSKGRAIYFPQKTKGKLRKKMTSSLKVSEINNGDGIKHAKETFNDEYYPKSIQEFSLAGHRKGRLHPTQKPVALMEYLIKTYTNEGETILDFTAGSFTTGVACVNLGRNFIGIEMDDHYYDIGTERVLKTLAEMDGKEK
jgi:site-specific DNA-methyltransferase (adenine-specific)